MSMARVISTAHRPCDFHIIKTSQVIQNHWRHHLRSRSQRAPATCQLASALDPTAEARGAPPPAVFVHTTSRGFARGGDAACWKSQTVNLCESPNVILSGEAPGTAAPRPCDAVDSGAPGNRDPDIQSIPNATVLRSETGSRQQAAAHEAHSGVSDGQRPAPLRATPAMAVQLRPTVCRTGSVISDAQHPAASRAGPRAPGHQWRDFLAAGTSIGLAASQQLAPAAAAAPCGVSGAARLCSLRPGSRAAPSALLTLDGGRGSAVLGRPEWRTYSTAGMKAMSGPTDSLAAAAGVMTASRPRTSAAAKPAPRRSRTPVPWPTPPAKHAASSHGQRGPDGDPMPTGDAGSRARAIPHTPQPQAPMARRTSSQGVGTPGMLGNAAVGAAGTSARWRCPDSGREWGLPPPARSSCGSLASFVRAERAAEIAAEGTREALPTEDSAAAAVVLRRDASCNSAPDREDSGGAGGVDVNKADVSGGHGKSLQIPSTRNQLEGAMQSVMEEPVCVAQPCFLYPVSCGNQIASASTASDCDRTSSSLGLRTQDTPETAAVVRIADPILDLSTEPDQQSRPALAPRPLVGRVCAPSTSTSADDVPQPSESNTSADTQLTALRSHSEMEVAVEAEQSSDSIHGILRYLDRVEVRLARMQS